MKFCYFPIQVLKSQEKQETTTELKDGRIVTGILEEMDIFMNGTPACPGLCCANCRPPGLWLRSSERSFRF